MRFLFQVTIINALTSVDFSEDTNGWSEIVSQRLVIPLHLVVDPSFLVELTQSEIVWRQCLHGYTENKYTEWTIYVLYKSS